MDFLGKCALQDLIYSFLVSNYFISLPWTMGHTLEGIRGRLAFAPVGREDVCHATVTACGFIANSGGRCDRMGLVCLMILS